jgi:hypothetical protein
MPTENLDNPAALLRLQAQRFILRADAAPSTQALWA